MNSLKVVVGPTTWVPAIEVGRQPAGGRAPQGREDGDRRRAATAARTRLASYHASLF